MNWQFLKKKCIDCYNINKGTKPDREDNPFEKGTFLLFPKYCPKHKRQIRALQRLVREQETKKGKRSA